MGHFKLKKVSNLVWEIEETENIDFKNSRYLFNSQIDKEKEIEMVINRIDFNYHKNFIIFGLKNIDLLAEIYKRKTPFSTIIIIEICSSPNEDIYISCDKDKLAFLFDRNTVNLTIGTQTELVSQLDSVLGDSLKLYNLRNLEIISMPYLKSTFTNEISSIKTTIFERLHTIITSFGNSVEDILVGTDNYLNNWKHVFRGLDFSYFEGMYKNRPAIVVGAGPSLDKNIEYLREAKGKALILCVDAALDSLLDKGIVPDIVASIERTTLITKFYKRDIIPDSIVYLGPNIIPGSVLERFNRIIFTGRKGDAVVRDLNSYIGFNNLEIGGNVSNILIAFAQYLGCSPIIFVGLDLAYTNGRTHTAQVADNLEDSLSNVYKESTVYVKGQNGEMLETFEFFMYAKNWIEILISINEEIKFINATEGGANIEGAENKKLKEVISKYCVEELAAINDKYDDLIAQYHVDKVGITKKGKEYFTSMEKYFNKIAKEAKNRYNEISSYTGVGLVPFMEQKRFSMQAELDKNLAGRFFIQSIVIGFNRDIHSFPMYLNKDDEERMRQRSMQYYDTLVKVSKKINETLKIYKRILDSYLIKFNNE
ncbi:motility associated factor glycosyltransferase family protein [Ruminiclostridium herbifermentans]|uniref:Motility associated factor glycosyltransferase family protein n=1 Tax=Ruminiclostridium herbifermentans TaxID=2488810 RepID=A0A4U7JGK8_9FIRM|nr:6-hydroxymethylpterin diphosphokinase MptE-like protein [Ruminiclostridium herbifermentans]QNU67114.1 motility associated factor glycosyltransferase family protein [Ruminiclostridium herbifermentans]